MLPVLISTTLLKDNVKVLFPFLTIICNTSLSTGVLLVSQKRAIIMPILKKFGTNPSLAADYRSISNLYFISKVNDLIAASQLTSLISDLALIDGLSLTWIKSFLCNRTKIVLFNDLLSNSVTLSSGVPQGSVLGSLLFVLYNADVLEIAAKHVISI